MSLEPETVTNAFSGLVFHNTYGANVTEAYRAAIITAETDLQSHFTNSVTVEMRFELNSLGQGFSAENTYSLVGVTYADYAAALSAHATTTADLEAVAGLPKADPSHGVGFWITSTEARVLGLSAVAKAMDDTVTLNSDKANVFGPDAVSTIEHEISEGVFGRVGSLGLVRAGWQPMDLFRFTADGQRDFTGGVDGKATFFGVDGAHLTTMQFHNAFSADGSGDGQDLGDWINSADSFGPGGPGVVGDLSATDVQVLDILGWTPASHPEPVANPVIPTVLTPVPPMATAEAHYDFAPAAHVMTNLWSNWVEL